MWQKSSLNFKLRFSFGIIAFILFIVGSLNIFFLLVIVKNVNHVDQLVREITEASKESSKGIQEITRAMSQLDQTTQMNSAAANEAAVASKNLSQQALSLNSISQTLKFTIEGQVAS